MKINRGRLWVGLALGVAAIAVWLVGYFRSGINLIAGVSIVLSYALIQVYEAFRPVSTRERVGCDQERRGMATGMIMVFWYYVYIAAIRFQLALGATRSRYVEWKAGLPLGALAVWVMMIIICVMRFIFKCYWFFDHPVTLFLGALVIAWVVWRSVACKSKTQHYERMFRRWPKRRRLVWDLATVAVLVLVPSTAFYLLAHAGRS